jgi:hypothetical protein
VDVGRADLQARDVAVVVQVGLPGGEGHVEVGQDEEPLQLGVAGGIEQGDLEQVVAFEHLARDPHLLGDQAHRRDAAALAVAAVLHLDRGLVDEAAPHRHRAGETGDAAATLGRALREDRLLRPGVDPRSAGQQPLGERAHRDTSSTTSGSSLR